MTPEYFAQTVAYDLFQRLVVINTFDFDSQYKTICSDLIKLILCDRVGGSHDCSPKVVRENRTPLAAGLLMRLAMNMATKRTLPQMWCS